MEDHAGMSNEGADHNNCTSTNPAPHVCFGDAILSDFLVPNVYHAVKREGTRQRNEQPYKKLNQILEWRDISTLLGTVQSNPISFLFQTFPTLIHDY
jgi:hypothetical protein